MALLRKLFYKKPPDGLLEISERLYVFDCCFTTDAWEPEDYKSYMGNTIGQLKEHYPDASILIFNFGEKESSPIASALWDYELTIMDYPRQYGGCPLLPMEVVHHFLRSSESWLSLGQQNILLMHCERGGWPVLAYMLAALLIYRKQYTGEYKTLDMVYKQAPRELLQLLWPLNPIPSQLRYLQYVSRRNVTTEWPPLDRALTLDCVIIRMIPDFDGNGGCCPIFRIYGQDPFFPSDKTPKHLFSTSKRSKNVRYYKQEECELVKIDINCHLQGDIVMECISLDGDLGREKMMYRAMFNTAFIRSNILILNRDEIDVLWDAKDLFPQKFRAELLFSEMDAAASIVPVDLAGVEEEGLPIEAFDEIQEMFNSVDWLDPKSEAALNVLHQIAASDIVKEKLEIGSQHHGGEKVYGQAFESRSDVARHKLHSSPSSPQSPSHPVEKSAAILQKCPVAQPHLPSSEQSQEVADSKVKPIPPPRSPSLKDTKETTVEPSTPTGPETPPMRDKRGAVLEQDRSPRGHKTESAFRPSILHASLLKKDQMDNKVEYSQSISSPPAPATPPLKDHSVGTETTSTAPVPPPPPPPPALFKDKAVMRASPSPPPPPPPPPPSKKDRPVKRAGPYPPPPCSVREGTNKIVASLVPSPPPPPAPKSSGPPPPPPPIPSANGIVKTGVVPPPPPPLSRASNVSGTTPPPLFKGRSLSKTGSLKNQQAKKLKPLHWLKLTRAVQGSLWAETQKSGEAAKAPEIDISELESLFSASNPKEQGDAKSKSQTAFANKPERVQLIDHRRAYNCEIMLSKVRIPLNELMDYVLALEESVIYADQVDNLIKFCPTKEEMETLKGYKGEKDKLGKCEQFFLELMKVPRAESKLRVFSFKLQFKTQVSDLRNSLNIVNSAVEETRSSAKLKRVMQTILSLGNALNQGTARGSAVGFRLDSLLKLTETRARNNRMTLMHYLCKVLADKLPEVLDFSKDLGSLEPAAKIQPKYLAEEMQAISKGLEKVVQELSMAENDGPVSDNFRKALKEFLCSAEGEVRSLASLYSGVGKNVDALIIYFGEDPTRCPYEQVVSTLLKFVRMFNQANEENAKQLEAEKKKTEKEASNEKLKRPHIKSEHTPQSPVKSGK